MDIDMNDTEYNKILKKHPLLLKITPAGNFRRKVASILYYLELQGFVPKIHKDVLRTIEQQKKIVAAGHSQTLRSYHLPGEDGLSRAADIICKDLGWNFSLRFQIEIGRLCVLYNCGWGGFFGFSAKRKAVLIKRLIARDKTITRNDLSWDTAHVQKIKNW